MTPEPKVGDEVCLFATVVGGAGTPFIEFTITNSTGAVYGQVPCILASSQGEKDGSLISCQAYWDTGLGYQGNEPVPGSYRLYVTTQPYSSQSSMWLPFTLS
jgi:hypothetical protein